MPVEPTMSVKSSVASPRGDPCLNMARACAQRRGRTTSDPTGGVCADPDRRFDLRYPKRRFIAVSPPSSPRRERRGSMHPVGTAPRATRPGLRRVALTSVLATCMLLGGDLLIAAPAVANQPTVVVRQLVLVETLDPLGVSCSGFDILENNTTTRTITDFYDENGNFLKETEHVSLVGTIVNSRDLSK